MTTDEIIAMATEAGLLPDNSHPTPETRAMRKRCEAVKRFAALAAAKEREACASFRQPFPQNGYFGHASIMVWTSLAWPVAEIASSEYRAAHSPNTTVAAVAY